MERPDQAEKGKAFRALHAGEPFVIPNPWDAGSARALEALGFKALASTSSGFAFTLGRRDGQPTLDDVAAHVTALADATTLPISVDMENGYGREPEAAARAVQRVAEAGAVGGSIEDWDAKEGLYDPVFAVERVAAAVEAIRGNPDLEDTIARLQAYEAAGADVVYAPGLRTLDEVRAVCEAASQPVNVLARPDFTMAELAEAGAQRVSVGGALTWTAVQAFASAAETIRDRGDFSGLAAAPPLDEWF